ncbi:SpoIIE family protein phosphatase [Streptomyces sp. Ru72]|uniref:SpoIIE family protein phosphatase n=1 Tax=Streptomyces sp. Ru72 TaxID=2080747 RepID=UPI00215611EE|nr:SpoIIE family protein phosphatase [Streptomyces sp. Ru72]
MLTEWLLGSSPVAVMVYDRQLRSIWQNAAMARLLGLSEHDRQGKRLVDVLDGPDVTAWEQQMRQVLLTGESALAAEIHGRAVTHPEHDRVFAVSASALKGHDGQVRGVCTVAADITEEYQARQRLALLNEASTRIGSTLDVIRTAQELADVAVPLIGDWVNVDLLDTLLEGEEPGPFAEGVALRRVANQSVIPGAPEALRQVGEVDFYPAHSPPVRCMATSRAILHRVTDPAVQDWLAKDPVRADSFRENDFKSIMGVPVCARGTVLGVAIFLRRSARRFTDGDRLLAEDLVARAAVCLDNARRFSRERTAALGLQQSLLPRGIPQQPAVEAAYRYLPAGGRTGVGGDWFDVIPLSGARVALVVGDVVGHGLEAAAAMGRLRTAVRTLADVDVPPDELLTRLDDLVLRIADEDGGPGTTTADLGATCAYAVYDPVSRTCTCARAGHPPPFVVDADGTAKQVKVPVGPPLGLGSLPFESVEVPLDDGSLIALYTDGLLDAHKRDLDLGLDRLRTALARPCPSLEDLCDSVVADMVPTGHSDDIALVIARTRPLDTAHVAAMEVPADPAAVADTRSWALDRLAAWGLDDHSFVTELVVSELVTNAIRYGQPPIQLRLLNVGNLICEVSDASSTAPHMRRARLSDEGGRGLLLVAQLTHRWGTRHSRQGKTIWCEQPIRASS